MKEEHCETCCIRDMILCGLELINCGYDEYWNDINLFARNQLVENQVRYTGYVECDNSLPDGNGITYRDIDKRMRGGFTGGSEPNSISLTRFRSIAGCCVGTAPVAIKAVWDNVITNEAGAFILNIPCDKETDELRIKSFIPDEGRITLTAKTDCKAGFRIYSWMGKDFSLIKNGKKVTGEKNGSVIILALEASDTLELVFTIETKAVKETVRDTEFTVYWRGCDVIDITPRGEHVRLYQRDKNAEKYYPLPEDVIYTGAANMGPTQQKNIK